MIVKTTYSQNELLKGICTSCNEISNEILKNDDRCIDCIETEKFFEATMQNEKQINNYDY